MNNNYNRNYRNYITFIIILLVFCINFSLILYTYNNTNPSIINKNNSFYLFITLFFLSNALVVYLLYKLQKRNNAYEVNLYNQKEEAFVTLNSIGDAVITTNNEGYITFLNPIAEKLTGYSNSESQGKFLDDIFTIVNENSLQEINSPIKKVLKECKVYTLDKDVALLNRNNEIYSIEDSMAPIKNKKQELIGAIVIFYDITDKKKINKQLEENKKILIEQSKMAAMGEMLENIAHQWRHPLSSITTASTGINIKKELADLDDKFLLDSLELINNSSQYLSHTIDDFTNFFKPDKRKELFLLSNVYDKTISLLNHKLQHQNIKIIENIEKFEIEGFENELVQVFMNLFNNSIYALENIQKGVIYIDIYSDKEFIYIRILDNAGGVEDKNISRIFEPYFTTKHQSQGTGIGLYMTNEIISRHMDGNIYFKNKDLRYENKEYRGAEFLIKIPFK